MIKARGTNQRQNKRLGRGECPVPPGHEGLVVTPERKSSLWKRT